MEYYREQLCVTYEELTSGETPVIKACTLAKNTQRQRIQVARRGGGEGACALYVYSSLPTKYQKKWVEKYGDPEEMQRQERLKARMVVDEKAREFYEAYEYDLNGVQTHLKTEVIAEYTLNASVLNALMKAHIQMEMETRKRNNPRRNLWPCVQDLCEALREVYPHTLPANLARLKTKISSYKKEGYISLVSGKLGNSNTMKIVPEAQELLVALKRSKVPIYTDRQIFDEFNRRAEIKGWKPLKSLSGLRSWFKRSDIEQLWYDAVHGEQSARLRFDRRHLTKLPDLRDTLWYGDGTRLNLYYRDERGQRCTLQVYEIIDAATEVLLGYHISESEDYNAQYHALRMAIQISGHKPLEIVTDNQGGHKKLDAQGLLSKVAVMPRPTAPYNGRSKTIESIFGRFQQEVLHSRWYFTGQNITAKKETSRPDMEFIAQNHAALPTRAELLAEYAKAREEWNALPHPKSGQARLEMYNSQENPMTPVVGQYDLIDMFWLRTEKPSTFTASGIKIKVGGREFCYEVFEAVGKPDLVWRRTHTNERFYVQYDPADMTSVRLITLDGRFERIAKPPIVIARAHAEQTEADKAFIREMDAAVKQERVERIATARAIEQKHGMSPEQHGLNSPRLLGLDKEYQEELRRRTAQYKIGRPSAQSYGATTKMDSNRDWNESLPPTAEEVYRRAIGKM